MKFICNRYYFMFQNKNFIYCIIINLKLREIYVKIEISKFKKSDYKKLLNMQLPECILTGLWIINFIKNYMENIFGVWKLYVSYKLLALILIINFSVFCLLKFTMKKYKSFRKTLSVKIFDFLQKIFSKDGERYMERQHKKC